MSLTGYRVSANPILTPSLVQGPCGTSAAFQRYLRMYHVDMTITWKHLPHPSPFNLTHGLHTSDARHWHSCSTPLHMHIAVTYRQY